jgi:integrase
MSPEQVAAMIGAVSDRYRALVVVLAGTGLRSGEVLGLTVDRVNFLKREIRVDRQLITTVGASPTFGPCKTESSVRTIPAPDLVLDELARHIEQFGPGADGLGSPTARATRSGGTHWGTCGGVQRPRPMSSGSHRTI